MVLEFYSTARSTMCRVALLLAALLLAQLGRADQQPQVLPVHGKLALAGAA